MLIPALHPQAAGLLNVWGLERPHKHQNPYIIVWHILQYSIWEHGIIEYGIVWYKHKDPTEHDFWYAPVYVVLWGIVLASLLGRVPYERRRRLCWEAAWAAFPVVAL